MTQAAAYSRGMPEIHPATPQQVPLAPGALRERHAARYIDRSPAYLKKGRMLGYGPPFVRIGRSVLYRLADLDAWLARHVVRLEA